MAYEVDNFDFNKHIDFLIDIAKSIKKDDITVITGPNGYGKSFLRKLLGQLNGKYDFPIVASISMETRTTKKHEFSALGSLMMDSPDDATSNHTCYSISSLFKNAVQRYLVIDEPEIGMGKEILLGLIEDINNKVSDMKSNGTFLGIAFITHSEFFIDHIKYDTFINLEGMTYDEWKNREIKAISPEKLSKWSLEMWRAIDRRLK